MRFILACLLLATATLASAADNSRKAGVAPLPVPAVAYGNAVAGKIKSDDERCQECHGHDGNANDIGDGVGNVGKFPKLAGQKAAYIIKQIRDFRSGARNHELMAIMARSVDDRDLADIAAYFSEQPVMRGDGATVASGRDLYAKGDARRGIPACVGCHGEAGKGGTGTSLDSPIIGGQHRRYLDKQLREWRAAERRNSPGEVMNQVAKTLGEADIEALTDYLSNQ